MPSKRKYRKLSDPPTLVCEFCKGDFTPLLRLYGSKNHGFYYDQKFCSKGCANKARPKKIWLDKHGYPQMRTPDGRNVACHRHMMEQKLGRRLLPTETVHHIDGNRANYDESNLELWSNRHGKGQRVGDIAPFNRHHQTERNIILGMMSLGG